MKSIPKTRWTFIVSLLLVTAKMLAYDFVVDGVCYNIVDEDGTKCAQVTQGAERQPGYNGKIVIPETVSYQGVNYRVTSIDDLTFYGYEDLTDVILPNSIVTIGSEAFMHCKNLTAIELPESLTKIDSNGFADCGFTSIHIPRNVTSLYRNVFSSCGKLRTITVDPANTVYDSRGNCNAIIEKEDKNIMTGCMNTVVPSDVVHIGPYAFSGCVGLKRLDLPSGFSIINFDAFHGCVNLSSISFPSSVWHVGDGAFAGCASLTSIHLPKRLTSLGENPFEGCSGLTSITVDEENYQYDSRNGCNAIIDKKKNVLLSGCQSTVIPNDVVKIDNYAFKNCTTLKTISIPGSVTNIGYHAFEGCTSLVSVSIPSSVTEIRSGAFEGCTSLESFVIPEGLTSFDSFLYGCSSLKSIVIPAGITYISSTALCECKDLTSIVVSEGNTIYDSRNNCNAIIETATNKLLVGCQSTVIPSDVTDIGSYSFRGCTTLTSIVIPDGVTSIGSRAFEGCSALASIVLPKSLVTIKEAAFEECENLKEIIIPEGVTSLPSYVFESCTSLASVTLPKALTSIGSICFYETPVKAITFPETMQSIGYRAFYKCRELTDVTVKSSIPISIADDTFYQISGITLYVPVGSKAAYEAAAVWKNFKEIKEGLGPDNTSFLLGDANGDGNLTIADYTAIAHYILGIVSANFNKKAADVNNDGKINVADCTAVAHLLLYGTIEKPNDK